MNPIPELYAYMLRNMLNCSNEKKIITSYALFKSMRKVIYKAPKKVFREIIREFSEDYNVLREINKTNFQIHLNNRVRKQLKRIHEYIFPIRI